jgi:hypothetical protein
MLYLLSEMNCMHLKDFNPLVVSKMVWIEDNQVILSFYVSKTEG